MNYEKRILNFLKVHGNGWAATDMASIWKRNKVDVLVSAAELKMNGKVKIGKDGVLSLR